MPPAVIGVVVLCDQSLFSPPVSAGFVFIKLLGYVQAKAATPYSTMEKWLDYATWKLESGGLTSDNGYMSNMREVPEDEWTR